MADLKSKAASLRKAALEGSFMDESKTATEITALKVCILRLSVHDEPLLAVRER